jgi:hypothetical protein
MSSTRVVQSASVPEEDKTVSGAVLASTDVVDGLDRSGYHYAHGKKYYKDGKICEPPKRAEGGEEVAQQASQSKWNFNDYHWEERDIIPHVKARLDELLLNQELWTDKRSTDALTIKKCAVHGWAVSNVRKGTTKNMFEFTVKVYFWGKRDGAQLGILVEAPGLESDELVGPSGALAKPLPKFGVVTEAGDNLLRSKVLGPDGTVSEKVVGEVPPERAMRTNEMFLKLVTKKGVPLVQAALAGLLAELASYGQQRNATAEAAAAAAESRGPKEPGALGVESSGGP